MISIIIPTYDEKENIEKLIPIISGILEEGYDYEMIIVDDNSSDGTTKVAEELSREYPIKVLKRNGKFGLASAILHGFRYAKGDILGIIDADLQHPPEYIKEFVQAVNNGYDIVIGSRYIEGGKIEGWNKIRRIISKGAIILSKPLHNNIKDPISGYFFMKKSVIQGINFSSIGYKLLLEIIVKGNYKEVIEIPYTFKIREKGKSKMGMKEMYSYINLIGHLYRYKLLKYKNVKL